VAHIGAETVDDGGALALEAGQNRIGHRDLKEQDDESGPA
jgi:hypothetical protein